MPVYIMVGINGDRTMKLQETIEDWGDYEIREIRKFVSWWRSKNKEDPENYPLCMDEGEFDEQYRLWD